MTQEQRSPDKSIFESLKIPPDYKKYDETTETEIVVQLEEWKRNAFGVLCKLRDDLRALESVSASCQAEVVYYASPFDGDGPWVLDSSREVVRGKSPLRTFKDSLLTEFSDILATYASPTADLQERVLRNFIKPIFQPNPHPSVNVETGRKLPRAAGGPLSHLDFMEGQEWKNHPGVSHVIYWCLSHADVRYVSSSFTPCLTLHRNLDPNRRETMAPLCSPNHDLA